jgi:hypothetical protein
MGLTFEKVWAMFQESDRRMQKLSEETDRKLLQVAQQIEKTDRQIKATNIHIGGLDNRFGELAEHLVAPNIAEKFNALGFHFNYMSAKLREIIRDKNKRRSAEIDILLENEESVVGVEVKSKPSQDDVKDHMRRLEKLRSHKDRIGDKRKIYGALAGAIMLDDVKTAILNAGLYAITQSGDTVKIDIPEGFAPKTW